MKEFDVHTMVGDREVAGGLGLIKKSRRRFVSSDRLRYWHENPSSLATGFQLNG